MVRLKNRYILFDITYPPSNYGSQSEFVGFSSDPQTALLLLHRASPAWVEPKMIILAVRHAIEDHYGEHGAGLANSSVVIKYFSPKTSTGIIRCSRSSTPYVVSAMTLLNRIGDREVVIRAVHISGTIRKCEQASTRRSQRLMAKVDVEDSPEYDDVRQVFAPMELESDNE